MKIIPVREDSHSTSTTKEDREVFLSKYENCVLTGRNLHYPNVLVFDQHKLLSPYDEMVMSLKKTTFYDGEYNVSQVETKDREHIEDPVFFFIYNVDNYFHFIYDTLPYLVYFFELKEKYPNMKLLLATSSPHQQTLHLFVQETLAILGLQESILFASHQALYKTMYIGSSLTHGGKSNSPPSEKAFDLWERLKICAGKSDRTFPEKIYISRRSWLSKHPENIGTNYTLRRKCVNETEMVEYLVSKGYTEVFCEDLSMTEKIQLFSQAKEVAGIIGGGMCNSLFSSPGTKVTCLCTPSFLSVNYRFRYSMDHTQVTYNEICPHIANEGPYTLYTRVKYNERIGEINAYCGDGVYSFLLSSNDVAGFSQDFQLETHQAHWKELVPMDYGLNSPFEIQMNRLKVLV